MTELRLSEEAEQDLVDIYIYTFENFGFKQAEDYTECLYKNLNTIQENPGIGRTAKEIFSNLRRYTYKSHIIFYGIEEDFISIVRIVHHSMDTENLI